MVTTFIPSGSSPEFIIHPGETLAEAIEVRAMSQKELAIRTGVSEKHVSTVINGQKNITPTFAKKLEYALGVSAEFWTNLQANYDRLLLEYKTIKGVTEEELTVVKKLKELFSYWLAQGWIEPSENPNPITDVIECRKLLGVSCLENIPKLTYNAAYRKHAKANVDAYILYAWQRTCELLAKNSARANTLDLDRLRASVPKIKQVMSLSQDQIQSQLQQIFADCGVAFCVVPHFKGAPVQGFIKKTVEGALILCVTLRQKFADVFWFTLFHEVAHILNGDAKREFVDFDSVSEDSERKADDQAEAFLIDAQAYAAFTRDKRYCEASRISAFAKSQGVPEYIVQGRLMKDKLLPWAPRPTYCWAE